MLLEKIEKFSELSFTKCNTLTNIENDSESKAALQSCFFNLKNLKKMIDKNI